MNPPESDPVRRAGEARERARTAAERAAQLRAKLDDLRTDGDRGYDEPRAQQALKDSQEAASRAADLADKGFEHAAAAERADALVHDALADVLEQRADRQPSQSEELHSRSRTHRELAGKHRDLAKVDDAHLPPPED